MRHQSLLQMATRCGELAPIDSQLAALASLGRRWLQLHQAVLQLDTMIRALVRRTAPDLVCPPGIGIHTAAQLLFTAGGNPERLHSDAAFAALRGQSSRGQQRTRNFAERRRTIGDSRNDTLRVLKRYIARETFAIIRAALRAEGDLQQAA